MTRYSGLRWPSQGRAIVIDIGPSTAIIESRVKVVAALLQTKYGNY